MNVLYWFRKNWTIVFQILLFLCAILMPLILSPVDMSTIIGILLIIAGENFFSTLVYSEKSAKDIQKLKSINCKNDTILQKTRSEFSIEAETQKATHSIFLSGSTLHTLFDYRAAFGKIPKDINLQIVYTDFNNQELLSAFRSMVGYSLTESDLAAQFEFGKKFCEHVLRERPNTIIRKVNYIMPIVYVGIDPYEADSTSLIRAKHYLNNSNDDEELFIVVSKYGSEYFNKYREQIRAIFNTSDPH